jgi:hypothetical protein
VTGTFAPILAGRLAGPLTGRLAEVPVRPDRQTARSWAQEELTRREYQAERPGPIRMLLTWLGRQFDKLPAPDGINIGVGLTVAVLLLLALVGYVLWRSGGVHQRARARLGGVFDTPDLTATDHRRNADAAEAAEDLRTALLERFRAIARDLDDRALIQLTPGLTADELARRAATRLPALAADLTTAARAFDDVRYGDRPATVEAVRSLRELDERVRRTTPVTAGAAVAPGPVAPK